MNNMASSLSEQHSSHQLILAHFLGHVKQDRIEWIETQVIHKQLVQAKNSVVGLFQGHSNYANG